MQSESSRQALTPLDITGEKPQARKASRLTENMSKAAKTEQKKISCEPKVSGRGRNQLWKTTKVHPELLESVESS